MINKSWSPHDIGNIKSQVEDLKVKVKPNMPVDEIIRMQLELLILASSLTETISSARFYEAKSIGDKNRAYTNAFLLAEGSDRKRDTEAKRNPEYRVAENKSQEAEVYRKLLEDTKQDFLLIHYSLRAMLKDRTEDRKWEM